MRVYLPEFLNVGGDSGEAVNAIHGPVTLNELSAALKNHRNLVARIQEVLPEVTAEDPLAQDARLLQSPPRGA